jgi:stress response protein SCP2
MTTLIDACYYNQTSIFGGQSVAAIQHSGDQRDGTKEGFDEVITIDLARMPQNVQAIVLIMNSYQGGTLAGITSSTRLARRPCCNDNDVV